ncbi:Pr6Pr family membrane protein [Spirillospora sp. CA-294931]|uniref:Pr6Pr family membrane protein n=1 Tax=Spirillospora sp. CA-294931 TaxID=3240042 RepID=UPI003D8DA185
MVTALWRAALGCLAVTMVTVCFLSRRPGTDAVDYFSYFTILSNLVGAAALLAGTVPAWRSRRWLDWLRGAAALYLAITGIVYAVLMGGEAAHWTGWVQHRIMPVAMPLDWLLIAPAGRLPTWRTLLGWLAFPLGYLVYTLAHGAATSWYPYPFLNAARYGYTVVTGYTIGIAATFVVFAALLLGAANRAVPQVRERRAAVS